MFANEIMSMYVNNVNCESNNENALQEQLMPLKPSLVSVTLTVPP